MRGYMTINTQELIFLTRVRLERGGMGWVHHSWLSCNPPICWMRQNMANGHPGLGVWRHVITSLRHGVQSLDKMTHNVHNGDTLSRFRSTEDTDLTALLRYKAVKDLLFPWSGSLVSQRGPLTLSSIQTFRIQYIHKNMTFKKIGKINCALRADILFSEFINIYVAAIARVFRKYFAELVPVFI